MNSDAGKAFQTPLAGAETWPAPLDESALYGPAGAFVVDVAPHTEADEAALLVQFLVYAGNLLGRRACFRVEADSHYPNLFACIVGDSSRARKGTSEGYVLRVAERVDPEWALARRQSGLSSGEGLIHAVRDARGEWEPKEKVERVVDLGVADKRLLVIESEMAGPLRVMSREGNTLSAVLRNAWDGRSLRILTRKSPEAASEAHISLIGHITAEELRRELTATDAANGFGNRFLWVCAKRSKLLPDGGALPADALQDVVETVRAAVSAEAGSIGRDDEARELWCKSYPHLTQGRPGLLGAVTSRAEAQTMRLALVYALLDGARQIRVHHLQAALAVWRYCADSARHIFGDALGDPTADAILTHLRRSGGLDREDINRIFQGHKRSAEIERALGLLFDLSLAYPETEATNGRPRTIWRPA